MNQETIQISGMTCAACARRIEKAVSRLEGVSGTSVNQATEKLSLELDTAVTTRDDVEAVIEKIGFGVVEAPRAVEVTIPIGGMTCTACAARIEKVLNKREGVESASVNYATEKAVVRYLPGQIRTPALREAIEKLGYTPLAMDAGRGADEDRLRREGELRALFRRFVLAGVFALPLLYLAMAPMISFVTLPYPAFLHPDEHPIPFALAQLALTIPIVIAGRRFYTVGFKSLEALSPNMDSLIAIGTSAAVLYSLYSTVQVFMGVEHAAHNLYF